MLPSLQINRTARPGREMVAVKQYSHRSQGPGYLADLILMPVPVGLHHQTLSPGPADNIDIIMMGLDPMGETADIRVAALDQVRSQGPLGPKGLIKIQV